MKQTAIVDLEVYNRALGRLQVLEGSVSFAKILPIINTFQAAIIPPPDRKDDEECPSPTPQKSSSKRSETSTK